MKLKLSLLLSFLFLTLFTVIAQDESPYAMFGYEGKVLMTPQERQDYMLMIPNANVDLDIVAIGIEPGKGAYYYFDADNNVVETDVLERGETARFLSVDPLTQSYPWYTPYQFAGNKPIWAVDLDGLEELIYTESIKDFMLGINKVLLHSDELNSEYSSYQSAEKKHVKIYLMAQKIEGSRANGQTQDMTSGLHYYKQMTEYLVAVNKTIEESTKEVQEAYNIGKTFANTLGLSITEIDLNNEYYSVVMNERFRIATDVGDEDKGNLSWEDRLKDNMATFMHEIKGHIVYTGESGYDDHNYLFGFDIYQDHYSDEMLESFKNDGTSPTREDTHPESPMGQLIKLINETVDKISEKEKNEKE